ncbi:hypothetical protein LMH73_009355 [Vibrio splendidus]|nr:hypothetical protein [Vibrio splendidus]MCC4881864.1 hypothetical protein [Vibrio splendidus]
MYFLKDIQGKRIAFPTLKELFVFLEAEVSQRFNGYRLCQVSQYKYSIPRMIGDGFLSKIVKLGFGYEDNRNANIYHPENPFEKEWLASENKYIVLDGFGRVMAKELILERYCQRYDALYECNYRYNSHVNNSAPGTKFLKNWSKRYTQRYQNKPVCRAEMYAITSKDEFDLDYPIRTSRESTLKSLNVEYDTAVYRDGLRSWKDQSKKNKQWN